MGDDQQRKKKDTVEKRKEDEKEDFKDTFEKGKDEKDFKKDSDPDDQQKMGTFEKEKDDEDFKEKKKKKNMLGAMTFTEEQIKAIVQHANEVAGERTAKACKSEFENQLVKLCEEKNAIEKYWTDRVKDMEKELNKRKSARGGAARILQLEAKVKKLEAENMALECELGEVLEMLSDHESEEEEVELEEEEMSDSEAEELAGKEKEEKDKDKKKKYSWDAQKAREERTRFWRNAFKQGEDVELND